MYLEIDEGFDAHPKTVRLCRVLGDVNAGQYLIRLWAWACRSAPDGNLSGMEAGDIEAIAKYRRADGKLFSALTERWSTKFGPWLDSEGNSLKLHGWEERTGAAISKMEKRASDMRALRDRRKRERDGTVTAQLHHGDATNQTRPDQTRPDQSSPDKTRPGDPPARDPGTTDTEPVAPPAEPERPFLPDTPERLKCCLDAAMQKARPERCPYSPGQWWDREAGTLLRDIGTSEDVSREVLRRIGLFVKDDRMAPWTVKKFCAEYNGIGVTRSVGAGGDRIQPRQANYGR